MPIVLTTTPMAKGANQPLQRHAPRSGGASRRRVAGVEAAMFRDRWRAACQRAHRQGHGHVPQASVVRERVSCGVWVWGVVARCGLRRECCGVSQ